MRPHFPTGTQTPTGATRGQRSIGIAGMVSVLAMVFLLGAGAMPRPVRAHHFRSRTQTPLILDQGDSGMAGEAAAVAPALPVLARAMAPLPVPQPVARQAADPLPRRREGFRRTQALRGPPLAR